MRDALPTPRRNADAVLLVDDDPIFCSVAEPCLQRAGFVVAVCRDGIEALDYLADRNALIAMVDLSMPQIDGFRLITIIRSIARHRHLPIMVVSARNDVDAIEEAYRSGADAFITKPVNWTILPYELQYAVRASQEMGRLRARIAGLEDEIKRLRNTG